MKRLATEHRANSRQPARQAGGNASTKSSIAHKDRKTIQRPRVRRSKQQRFDLLLNDIQRITHLGNWEWDIVTNTLVWSDELYRIFGLNNGTSEVSYEKYVERIHPDDRDRTCSVLKSSLQTNQPFTSEHRIVRPDGAVRFLETHGEVMTNKANQPVRMLGCCLDVTERKLNEKKLATSVSLLNATLESTADGLLVVDLAGHLASFNQRFVEMWQLPVDLMDSYEDHRVLAAVLEQLKKPEAFMEKVRSLYENPEMESFDVLEFKDGRIFERFSRPQKLGTKTVGRVWSFRDTTERYRVMETLRQSEERYRSLVIATAQVVWRIDPQGRLLDDGESCRRYTGQTSDEILKGHWLDAVHPEDRKRAAEAWTQATASHTIFETEYRLRRADGEWREMCVRGVPLLNPDGKIHEWIGSCQDITNRKRQERIVLRERDFMDAMINSLPGIFYLLDETGLNLRWNKNLEIVTGYSAAEIAQMHAVDFVPDEEKRQLAERVQKVFKTGYGDIKTHLLCKDGKSIPYYCTGTRVDFEGKPRLVGMGIDVSQLQKAKEEIRKLNRDLGRRVLERTAQLNTTNKELEAFSYSVSHDLRAPLRAISGFAKVLKEDYRERLNEEGLLFVEKILQAGDRMSHLIDDLLNYSRIGRSAINLHPVPLNDLVNQIAGDFTHRIQTNGGKLSVAKNLPVVNGDFTLLAQVFANIFENAITYRKRDVPLEISVSSQIEKDHTVICISDNGIGIAPAHHERIFEVFQRLHTHQQYPGTGIGLANAKKSIELLGGKIWVESELEKGSTFCIELKLAEPETSR